MKKKNRLRLSEIEKREIDRRIEEITKHPETLISWERVQAKMDEKGFSIRALRLHNQNPSEGITWEELKNKIHEKYGF